jgi:hypothetical protein
MKQLTAGVCGVAAFGAAALVAALRATMPAPSGASFEPVPEAVEGPATGGAAPRPVATAIAASAANVARLDSSTPALPVAAPPPAPLPTRAQAVLAPADGGDGPSLGESAASRASRQGARHQRQAGLIAQLRHNRASPRREHATAGTACPQGDCSASSDHVPLQRNAQQVEVK